ncbi:MAG: ferredoxin reductase family protein [Thermoleophilia bacterium]|nr:ferredoxin reductase family protein [Thermoleophilia bacterium]
MVEAGTLERLAVAAPARARRRAVGLALVWAVVLGNAAAIVWLWAHGGNLHPRTSGDAVTSAARITGLVSAYTALIQVLLLARLPALERLVGFDRLTVWHRWNGHLTFDLVVAHVVLSVWGYALLDRYSLWRELSTMIGGGVYPGMVTATVGTVALAGVVGTSYAIARRRLPYEWWYGTHLLAYAGIALAWFHQIPTGNELVLDTIAADYWRSLYAATLALLVGFRVAAPALGYVRHRLRVAEVVAEAPGVVSLRIEGRRLERLRARPGQFFLWRFLVRGRWWTAHPFSLSAAPDGRSLRITVKALGDHSARMADVPVGTRVLAEGPFGVFTADARRCDKLLLVAGGIGVTPIRALLEELRGDVVVVYRVVAEEELVLGDELRALAARNGFALHEVVGDHRTPEGSRLLTAAHLRELVPDVAEREVFLCGPPALADLVRREVRRAGVPRRRIHAERFVL